MESGTIIIFYIDTSNEEYIKKINEESDLAKKKYHIKLLEENKISLKLPFSGGKFYEENRMSRDILCEVAKQLNLSIVIDRKFTEIINPDVNDYYTYEDFLYSEIHRCLILKK
jgi:hypothetical protein